MGKVTMNQNDIKVSIIVSVYNMEDYLSKCLDSLLVQTLKEIEIIVVNDGSTDNSQDIIESYAQKNPNVIPLTKKNGGQSEARNYGVQHAKGEYITFVDSDDYVDRDAYELMYKKAIKTEAEVVCCAITHVFRTNVHKCYLKDADFGYSVLNSPMVLKQANSYAWNKLYKREFWINNGFEFPVGKWYEDIAVIYNVLLLANKVECVNIPLYHFSKFRDEAISQQLDERVFHIFEACEKFIEFYATRGSEEVLEAIEHVCIKHILDRLPMLKKGNNKKLALRYIDQTFEFFNKHFEDWENSSYFEYTENTTLYKRIIIRIKQNKQLMKTYVIAPDFIRTGFRVCFTKVKKIIFSLFMSPKKITEMSNEKKRSAIQQNGLFVLNQMQKILNTMNIISFADSGTLLDIIKDGQLAEQNLDINLGIIAERHDREKIRIALERAGYRLLSQNNLNEQIVGQSYTFLGIPINLNYYEVKEEYLKTWIFYQIPKVKYEYGQKNIVEITCSSIKSVKTELVKQYEIQVPKHAEQILEEKYGKEWRTLDTSPKCWESPAAVKLDQIGETNIFKYIGSTQIKDKSNFYQAYEKELKIVKKLQQQELTILREVDKICKEHNITYYLGEGTLLGAIRHKGFIPWDDDMDILMKRDDYEKFLKIAPGVISNKFEVQHWSLMKNYWSIFTKVRLLDKSKFFQYKLADLTENNGPYIDIFPLDSVPEKYSKKQIKQKQKITFLRKAIGYKTGANYPITPKTKRILPYSKIVPMKYMHWKLQRTYLKYSKPGNQYIVNLASYYGVKKQTFSEEFYGKPRYVEFEGEQYPIPQKAEQILKSIYNNYMALPPVHNRIIKHSMKYIDEVGVEREMGFELKAENSNIQKDFTI